LGVGNSIDKDRDGNKDFLKVVESFTVREVEVSEDVFQVR